jgi:uncharacterized membrane protein required for colicin V production
MVSVTILDFAILMFAGAVAVISARRGFAATTCSVVGILLALLAGILAAGMGTPALIDCVKAPAGAALEARTGLPDLFSDGAVEAAAKLLQALESTVLCPLVFALGFLAVTALWQYACLHTRLMNRFPKAPQFDQLYGAGLGLLKGIVLAAAAIYVLSTLGILSQSQLRHSLLLGRLWSLWQGRA